MQQFLKEEIMLHFTVRVVAASLTNEKDLHPTKVTTTC
jgi:hypothetical protein